MKNKFVLLLTVLILLFAGCAERKYNPVKAPDAIVTDFVHETATADVIEPYPPDVTLKFAACGDNIMYTGTNRDAKSLAVSGGREYNYAPLFDNIRDVIENADLAFINQETPMAGEGFDIGSYPHFNTPRDLAYDIIDAGFDIVNIATNHMLDAGSLGLQNTIEFWKTLPVTMIGGYTDEEDFDKIRIVEKDEMSIAFLSYTYGTNGLKLKSDYGIVIPYLDAELIKKQVKEAKKIADLVFVSVHWGNENNFTPSESQKELAQIMADLGVNVIIGHHPHVLQPIEWVSASDGDHKTLCIYSLGNIAAEQASDANLVGGIMTFDIVRNKGEYSIENPLLLPTVYYYNKSFYKNSIYLMEDFSENMAKSIGLSYYGKSTTLERLKSYVIKTIDAEFLPDYLK